MMQITLNINPKQTIQKNVAKFIVKNFELDKLSVLKIWSKISIHQDIFRAYWRMLDKERKRNFFQKITSLYPIDGNHFDSSIYDKAMLFFKNFSPEEKEKLAEYFVIKFASLSEFNKPLWWVPRKKRLDYLKRHTPMNNALCYSLFSYDSKYREEESLMSFVDTKKELLDKKKLAEYVNFLISKHGRDAVYLNEAIERYKKWLANKNKK